MFRHRDTAICVSVQLENEMKKRYNVWTMKILNQQIFENKEAAALPGLMESGGLPALVSGLSGIHRVNLAAALYEKLELPMFVACPDERASRATSRPCSAGR